VLWPATSQERGKSDGTEAQCHGHSAATYRKISRAVRPGAVSSETSLRSGSRTAQIDLIDLYHNQTRILGSDSRTLDVVESVRRLDRLSGYFERGDFRPLPITAAYPLPEARRPTKPSPATRPAG
jgi:hypothetical protein